MANGGRIDYTVGFKADLSGLNSVRSGLKEIQNLTAQDYMIRFSTTNSLQQAERELETLKAQVAQIEVAYTKSFDSKLGVLNIQTLDKELSKAGVRTQNLFNTLAKVGQENVFNKMIEQATTANYKLKQTNDFLEDMGHTITSTIRWGIASRLMNEMVGSIKGSFSYIQDLDTSLNDIRIVTGKSADEMERFARESNRAASKLGQTTKTYTDASLIYYQQGLSDKEVQARSETTLKAANVTGQTGEEVSQELTAVWNGYKVSAEEAELYVDKLAAVAATTASNLEELSTGMSKVASAASVMGVPIDQLNAMLATTISVTRQAPESIGTAYKTIFARIGDIEAGEGEVTLGQYTSKMKELGFNILDANQKLRDQGEVINEIGNNWNNLSREQQIALAQTMAGARQYNNLLALFDNWNMYTNALKTSADAAGTLNRQNETYLESTEAHLKQLTAAQEKFQDSLLNASTINDVSDALSGLFDILSKITDSIGGGKGLLLELGAILTRVFNKQIAENLMPLINNFRNLRLNAEMTATTLNNIKLLSGLGIKDTTALSSLEASVTKNAPIMHTASNETKQQWIEAEAGRAKAQAEVDAAKLRKTQTTEKMQKYGTELGVDFKGGDSGFSDQASQNILKKRSELASNLKSVYKDFNAMVTENVNLELKGNKTIEEKIQDLQTVDNKLEEVRNQVIQSHNLDIISDEQYNDAVHKLDAVKNQIATDKSVLTNAQNQNGPAPSGAEKANAYRQVYKAFGWDKSTPDKAQKFESFISEKGIKLSSKKGYEDQLTQKSQQALKAYGKEVGMSEEQIKKFTQAIQKAIIETEKFAKAQKDAQNYTPSEKEQKAFVAEQAQAQREKGQGQVDVEETIEDIQDVTRTTRQSNDAIRQSGEEATDAKSKVSAYENIIKELTDDQRRLVNTQAGVKLASDLTMIASVINNIQALPNIWQNNDISTGEKVLQTITNIGSTLGVALPSILSNINAIKGAATGLQASLGAIGLISMAIGAVIGAISAVVQWQENERKARIETNKAIIEENDARLQEIDANTKLYNSYSELEKSYKLGNTSKQELLNSTDELIDAYGIENGKLLKMTDNYEALAAAIKKKRLEDARDKETKAKESLKASFDIANDKLKDLEDYREIYNYVVTPGTEEHPEEQVDKIKAILDKYNIKYDYLADDYGSKLIRLDSFYSSFKNLSTEQLVDLNNAFTELNNGGLYSGLDAHNAISAVKSLDAYIKSEDFSKRQELESQAQQATFERTAYEKDLDSITTFSEYEQKVEEIRKSMSDIKDEDFLKYVDELGTEFSQLYSAQQRLLANFDPNNKEVQDFIKGLSAEELGQLVTVGLSGDETVEEIKLILKAVKGQLSTEDTTITMEVRGDLGSEKIADANEKLTEYTKLLDRIEKRSLLGQADILEDIGTKQIEKNSDYLKVFQMSGAEKDELKTSYQGRIYDIYQNSNLQAYENLSNPNIDMKELHRAMTFDKNTINSGEESEFWNNYAKDIQEAMSAAGKSVSDFYDEAGNLKEGITQENIIEQIFKDEDIAKLKALRQQVEAMRKGIEAIDNTLSGKEIQTTVFDLISEKSDEIITKFDIITQMGESMGDGFVIAADKVEEFASKFPELLKDYEVLSDGSIKLSQDQLQATVGAIHAEQKAKAEAQIKELDTQIELNEMKIKMMEEQNALTLKFLQGDMEAEEYKNEFTATAKRQEGELQDELNKLGVDSTNVALDNLGDIGTGVDALTEKFIKLSAVISAAARGEDASQVAKEFADTVIPDMTSVTQEFLDGIDSSKTMEDITKNEDTKAAYDQALKSYQLNLDQINLLKSENDQLKAQKVTIESGLNASLAAVNDNLVEQLDLLDDVVDRYHDINVILGQIERLTNKIVKEQDKLVGPEYLGALEAENQAMDVTNLGLQKKREIAVGEQQELQAQMAGYGFTFNKDGTIGNYAGVMQSYIDGIREAQSKGDKETAEDLEKRYDKVKELASNYDTLVNETIPDIDEEIEGNLDRKIENNIKKFNYAIKLQLDMSDAEKQWRDFRKKLLEKDDFKGQIEIDIGYLFNPQSLKNIENLIGHVNSIADEVQKMQNGETSSIYVNDLAQGEEDLEQAVNDMISAVEDWQSTYEAVSENLLNEMNKLSDTFNKLTGNYDTINEWLNNWKDVTSLTQGEESYAEFDNIYRLQHQANLEKLQADRESADTWKNVMDTTKEGTDEWNEAVANWTSASSQLFTDFQDAIKNAADAFSNKIKLNFQNFRAGISNGGQIGDFEREKYNWEAAVKRDEEYLDTVTKSYEIDKLRSKINTEINKTSSSSSRQKLIDFQRKELKLLEKKDKLSQYDIDRSNKKLEILQKTIALEEAQNNKSQMRLRRDSQGNYQYQYVADTSAIEEAEQELKDAYQALYQLDEDKIKENVRKYYDLVIDMEQQVQMAVSTLKGEALEKELNRIQNEFLPQFTELGVEQEQVYKNIQESATASYLASQSTAAESFAAISGYVTGLDPSFENLKNKLIGEEDSINSAFGTLKNSMVGDGEDANSIKKAFDTLGDNAENILPGHVTTGVANMSKTMFGEDGESGFKGALDTLFNQCITDSAAFNSNLEDIQGWSGIDITKTNADLATAADRTGTLNEKFKGLNTTLSTSIGRLTSVNKYLKGVIDKTSKNIDWTIKIKENLEKVKAKFDKLAAAAVKANARLVKIKTTDYNKTVSVSIKYPDKWRAKLNAFQAAINGLKGKTITIKTNHVTTYTDQGAPKKEETPKPNNDLNKLLSETNGLYYIDANGNMANSAEVDLSSKLTVTNNEILGSYNEKNVYQIKGNSLTGNKTVGAKIIQASENRKVYKNTKVGDSDGWIIPKGSYAIITGEETNEAHTKYTQLKFLDDNGKVKTAYYWSSKIDQFDTGGYTGNWNSKEGRMAMLHEKELVLNAKDTKNILAAVNSVRAMQSIITSLDLNALAVKKQMLSNLTAPIVAKEGITDNSLDQNVQIEANFPNVRDARQIEEAFDNLVNMATQYANKQTR